MLDMAIESLPRTLKFSYKYTRGNYPDTVRYAQDVINDTITEFIDTGATESVTVNRLKKIIKKVLPEKKRIDIKAINPNDPNYCGYQDYLTDIDPRTGKERYVGYVIRLPIENGKFMLNQLPVFIHEFTHVLNSLFTPKYTSQLFKTNSLVERITTRSVNKGPNFSRRYNEFYDFSLYEKEEFSSAEDIKAIIDSKIKELSKLLKHLSSEERIAILQNFRYFLQSEKCAYNSEQNLYTLMRKFGIPYDESLFELNPAKFLLDEKIKMLKDLCYEEIQKVRESIMK